jgi:cytosine permease
LAEREKRVQLVAWVAPLVGIVAASLTYIVLTAVLRVRAPLADAQA